MRIKPWQLWCAKVRVAVLLGFVAGIGLGVFGVQPAHASGGEAPKTQATGPLFVEIDPIIVPVIKKNGRSAMLALQLVAEVKTEKAKSQIYAQMPRVRDSFIRALYGNVERNRLVKQDGGLDMEQVKKRLLASANYVLKKDIVADILVNGVNHQTF